MSVAMAEGAELFIARASLVDAYDLASLRAASLEEMGLLEPAARAPFVDRAHREFRLLLREERMAAWMLVAASRPVGCAAALLWQRLPYPTSSLHAEIAGVYVEPAHRGNGYGSEMVREAISWARAAGVRKIVLHPSGAARGLYERMGFVDGNEMRLGENYSA
ncbi:MAG TPA: GNAT family N-acetyltransferase [Candidatus Dormibacteraeota bacterium]|nr:GNAT family N-acetyltransferase [Candidatus Dormibacteraeota bacterium]